MTALVTENMALLAEAPGGIPSLRQLILRLAVRGALVAQDPADATAARELEMLANARSTVAAKKTRSTKAAVRVAIEPPHPVPTSWQWCTLADVVQVLNGRAYKKEELLETGTPVLRVGNLFTSNHWYHSNLSLDDDKYCEAGDLIFAWSASFGPFIWTGGRVIYHYHIWKLKPHNEAAISKHYLNLFLQERTQAIKAAGHGVSMAHMTKEKMEVLPVALPPLAEQHSIVAKVDELMALCDRLEARQQDAEAAHAQLVQTLLDSLTQARDADEFQANWERLAGVFELVFTTDASVENLKQALRRLAFSGAITERSTADRRHVQVGDVVTLLNGYAFKSEWFVSQGVRLVRNLNIGHGSIDWREGACIAEDRLAEFSAFALAAGDVLLSLDRPIISTGLKVAVVRSADLPCLLLQRVARLTPKPEVLRSDYLLHWLRSPLFVEVIDPGRSNGVPHISTKQVAGMTMPLPSLTEQKRIVARLDELLTLCDQLKARIAAARAKHAQLAEALVAQAVT